MFLLALIYLIILVVLIVFSFSDRWTRYGGIASLILFAIIGFCLFWNVLNR